MGPVATQPSPALSGAPGPAHELRTLILSRHPAIAIETPEEERVDVLLTTVCPELRLGRFVWTVTKGLRRVPDAGPVYESDDPAKALAAIGEMTPEAVFELRDFCRYLEKPELSRAFRELLARLTAPSRMSTLVLVGARIELPPEVEPHVVRLELKFPSHDEYRRTVSAVTDSLSLSGRAQVEVGASELDGFARAVSGMTLNQARQAVARVAIEDGRLSADDLGRIAGLKAEALEHDGLLEFWPPADNSHELGGFASLERWLDRARMGFSEQAAELNLTPPRGVLLVGVQGCGKSLAAKAIARRWQLPLLKLDAGRLYDKYIGETERNLRRATGAAESMAPAVLWIDEIEKAFATGGGGDTDGGLSRRVLGTFLTWLQEKRAPVFVVATANDLSILPPELLRKGRFDEIFFVDLPDAGERAEIFAIHLRLRRQDPAALDIARLVEASEGFSGAEIEQAVIASLLGALHEGRALDTAAVVAELAATVPLSVTRAEDVARLREQARARFVPVR